jgi:hypothetical protein
MDVLCGRILCRDWIFAIIMKETRKVNWYNSVHLRVFRAGFDLFLINHCQKYISACWWRISVGMDFFPPCDTWVVDFTCALISSYHKCFTWSVCLCFSETHASSRPSPFVTPRLASDKLMQLLIRTPCRWIRRTHCFYLHEHWALSTVVVCPNRMSRGDPRLYHIENLSTCMH